MKTVTLIENKEKGDYVIINDGKTTMMAPVKVFLDRDDVDDFIVNFNSVNDKTEKFKSVMVNAGVYKRSLKELMYMLNANDTSEFVIDNHSRNMIEQALVGARTMVETCTKPEYFHFYKGPERVSLKFNDGKVYKCISIVGIDEPVLWSEVTSVKDIDYLVSLIRESKNKNHFTVTGKELENEINLAIEKLEGIKESMMADPCGEDGKNGDEVAGQVPDVDQECCRSYVNLEWLRAKHKLNEELEKRELVTKPLIKSLTCTNLKPGDDGNVEGRIKGFNMEFNEFPRVEEGKDPVEIYYNNYKEELLREIKERETDVELIYPSRDNHEIVDIEYFHVDDSDMATKIVELLKDGLYFRVVNYHAEQEYTIVMYLGHEDVEENGTKVYKSMIEVPAIGFKRYNYLASDVIRKIEDYMKSDECKKFVMKNWKNFKPTNNEPSTVKLENITRVSNKKYFTVSFQQIMDGVAKVNI